MKKKTIHNLIIIYPLLNIIVAYIFKGDKMNLFSWSYCVLLCALNVIYKNNRITKGLLLILPISVLTILISVLRESTFSIAVGSLLSSGTILYMMLYSEQSREIIDHDLFIKKSKLFAVVQTSYLIVLLIYVSRYGLRAGWNTYVLQGPYNYPHTLSYILLMFLTADLFYFLKGKQRFFIVLAGISILLIFMTAVRTTLVSVLIVLLYFFREIFDRKHFKYAVGVLCAGTVAFIVADQHGLFDALLKKSLLAVNVNNSFSNGRIQIALNSLRAISEFKGNKLIAFLCGIGMSGLTENNLTLIGAGIHAHNDFIDMLVCYGFINLVLYIYAFCQFSKCARWWILLAIGILAAGNGLYMYIDCIPMLVFARLLFESGDKLGAWSISRLFKRRKHRRYAKNIVCM